MLKTMDLRDWWQLYHEPKIIRNRYSQITTELTLAALYNRVGRGEATEPESLVSMRLFHTRVSFVSGIFPPEYIFICQ